MSTPCNGCKALVIQTADDYNVYSLQRAIYPVDPLMILPQPTSWVQLVCEDGTIIKKFYTQMDDAVTFWQQMLAECANHTVPEDPVVISNPNTDTGDDEPPVVDPPPDPDPDKVPGPDTVITPPPVAPPASPTPTPATYGGPMGWPFTPPSGYTPYPPGTPNPWVEPTPSETEECYYGREYNFTYICADSGSQAQRAIAWAEIYLQFFAMKAIFPHLYIDFSYENVWPVDNYSLAITAHANRLICPSDPAEP